MPVFHTRVLSPFVMRLVDDLPLAFEAFKAWARLHRPARTRFRVGSAHLQTHPQHNLFQPAPGLTRRNGIRMRNLSR